MKLIDLDRCLSNHFAVQTFDAVSHPECATRLWALLSNAFGVIGPLTGFLIQGALPALGFDELAEKANEGLLTDSERAEYEAYINSDDFIALLRFKAKRYLATNGAA